MRICVDLDSTVVDFFGGIWPEYRLRGGAPDIGTKDVKSWDWEGCPNKELFEPIFHEPGFFENLRPLPGAVAALKLLQKSGLEVVILSSHCTPHSAAEKVRWIARELPFIDKKHVIITKHKGAVQGAFIVDDSVDQAEAFKASNPGAQALTIAYEYNDDPIFDGRYHGYEDTEVAWMAIVHHILIAAGLNINPEKDTK